VKWQPGYDEKKQQDYQQLDDTLSTADQLVEGMFVLVEQ